MLCKKCQKKYPLKSGIPILLLPEEKSSHYREAYEQLHATPWQDVTDGSYDLFAAIAKGNKTLDIACGDGQVARLAPHVVSTDFSLNALLKAKRADISNLVCASAEALPFQDDSFDVSLCAGSLEHFTHPQQAILEMGRVSRIQIVTAHRQLFGPARTIASKILSIKNQPLDSPFSSRKLHQLFTNANLHILFQGVWTYPTNLRLVFPFLPEKMNPPSCHFVISIKK
jgi:SAM-dependent methyltransferase